MGSSFRESMAWLHSWAGVVLGVLLFAIFWMGTLSVFDREIDRWMMPQTRLQLPAEPVSLDRVANSLREVVPADSPRWQMILPSEREPVFRLGYRDINGDFVTRHLDPATGDVLPDQGTLAGTGFIFPFHYSLHLKWKDVGYWLVGLAGMSMLVLLLSGVVIHRRIFADFFTFRRRSKLPRSSLDLHNVTGVLGLPFHFVITLSGLMIFYAIYFPGVVEAVYDKDTGAFYTEAFGTYRKAPTGEPGSLASLDAMATQASQQWGGERPWLIRVWHGSDANATVEMRRTLAHGVDLNVDVVHFDAATAEVLRTHTAPPVAHVQRFIAGMHFIQFRHWPLRWLYFLLGLSGCAMIATGYIFWLETRRKRHARQAVAGMRLVEGLTIGGVSGLLVATLVFFVSNRLLPLGVSVAGYDRASLEMWAFYLSWLAAFGHAWLRPRGAWREQCWAIALLAVLAVVLNAVTSGDYWTSVVLAGYWPVAGMDVLLLAVALIAVYVARKLAHHERARAFKR